MRALMIALVLAVPLAAEEKKSTTANTATQPAATNTTAAAAPAAQPDSPLVAAAKRANRLGRKPKSAYVITNETLKTSGANAHVTTTASQTPIQMPAALEPPRPTPEMVIARAKEVERQKLAEQAEKDRVAKEEQQRKAMERAAATEEGYDGSQDDASEFVGTNPPPPQF